MEIKFIIPMVTVAAAIAGFGVAALCYFYVCRKSFKRKQKNNVADGLRNCYPKMPLFKAAARDIQIVQMLQRDQYSRFAELNIPQPVIPTEKSTSNKNALEDIFTTAERKRKEGSTGRTYSPQQFHFNKGSTHDMYFDEAINCTEYYYPQVDSPRSISSLPTTQHRSEVDSPRSTTTQHRQEAHTSSTQPTERKGHRSRYSSKREKRSLSSVESPVRARRPPLLKGKYKSEGNVSLLGSFEFDDPDNRNTCALRAPMSVVYPAEGNVEFGLFFNTDNTTLTITINRILDLYVKPINYIGILETVRHDSNDKPKSRPYLKEDDDEIIELVHNGKMAYLVYVSILPDIDYKEHTNVVFGSTNIIFSESFKVTGHSLEDLRQLELCLHVLSQFGSHGDPIIIGEVKVPMQELQACQTLPFMMEIGAPDTELEITARVHKEMSLGELVVVISYNPMTHQLITRIVQATSIPKCTMTGCPNVSVKTSLYYCNNRIHKQCTTIQRRQKEPTFNETFHFDMSKDRISECDLLFEIRHHGPVHRTVIGYVHVGRSAVGTGANHWRQLLDFSHFEKVSHRIIPNKPAGLL